VANPTAAVPTTSTPYSEEKTYWPLDPADTSAVYYAGEMMGMLSSTGYATHFDDTAPMMFLGTKEGIKHTLTSDLPAIDFKELIRRPARYMVPLLSGTCAIPTDIGKPAYAADSGHVQLTATTYRNLAGMVVDIGRQQVSSTTGVTTLTGASAVELVPPTYGALIGLAVQGFHGKTATAAPDLDIRGGTGGASTGATTAGAGAGAAITAGAGGAAAGSGTGGAGGSITLTPGAGGTSGSGTAGTRGSVVIAGPESSPVTAAQDLVTGNTITLPTTGTNKLLTNAGGAATGLILPAGLMDGQLITLFNTDANLLTFAAAGTSRVSDGTSSTIPTLTARSFIWSTTATRWFPVK
jgi:hypothetical protein